MKIMSCTDKLNSRGTLKLSVHICKQIHTFIHITVYDKRNTVIETKEILFKQKKINLQLLSL